jgi:kinesin family protein 14
LAKRQQEEALLQEVPHLKNINADPLMSGKIKCLMKEGRNNIGKKDPSGGEVTVLLAGAGIVVNHSYIVYDPSTRQSVIYPNEEDNGKYKTTVNGEHLVEPRQLQHGDRILIGSHHYFIYTDP